jgi:2-polyprenyl-6-methoxyphenol hydroxylase-like FAD-dependent oxidoreductase
MELAGKKVIVVGGGTGGAAAALLLARAGAAVTVLEKVARARPVGAGIGLAANGLAVMEALLGADAVAPLGHRVDEARIVDGTGRVLFRPRGDVPRVAMVRRSDLQACLTGALEAEPGVVVRHGAELTATAPDGICVVRSAASEDTYGADLVVGADGVHSAVRGAGDFGARVSRTGVSYLRGMGGPGLARGEEAWTPAGLFGSFAVPGGTYFYASASSSPSRRAVAARDLDAWREIVIRAYPAAAPILAGLRRWDELIVNEVVRVDCQRFFDGRLVLVGDAAHAMAPNLGQGANSALTDAAVLVDALRRAADLQTALVTYDERRRPAVQRVSDRAARLGALAERTHPAARWLRDRVLMPLVSRLAGGGAIDQILQESPAVLTAMCRAHPGRIVPSTAMST